MNSLTVDQMINLEAGDDVDFEVCTNQSVWGYALRIVPGVGSFCLGVAIGNWIYSD